MTARNDKIESESSTTANPLDAARPALPRSDEAVLSLARLLGRQMAREQFERSCARERATRSEPKS